MEKQDRGRKRRTLGPVDIQVSPTLVFTHARVTPRCVDVGRIERADHVPSEAACSQREELSRLHSLLRGDTGRGQQWPGSS